MGSSTNLLAVELVPEAKIQFLDLAPVGACVMFVGVLYCCILAPVLLPANDEHVIEEDHGHNHSVKARLKKKRAMADMIDVDRYTVYFALAQDGPLHLRSARSSGVLNC